MFLRQGPPSPRRGISLHSDEIFCSVRNSMQRSAIMPGSNFLFSRMRLLQGKLSRDRRVSIQLRPPLFAARQKTFRQLHGRNFPAANPFAELAHRKIKYVFAQQGLIRPLAQFARTDRLTKPSPTRRRTPTR